MSNQPHEPAKRAVVIGVMGAGENASQPDVETAFRLGRAIAARGWVVLCGGRNQGVMRAAAQGAEGGGGLSIGLMPGSLRDDSPCTLPLPTGLGSARNNVNVLASDVIVAVAFQPGMGTLSEMALAVKAGRPLIVLSENRAVIDLLAPYAGEGCLVTPDFETGLAHLQCVAALVMKDFQPLKITVS